MPQTATHTHLHRHRSFLSRCMPQPPCLPTHMHIPACTPLPAPLCLHPSACTPLCTPQYPYLHPHKPTRPHTRTYMSTPIPACACDRTCIPTPTRTCQCQPVPARASPHPHPHPHPHPRPGLYMPLSCMRYSAPHFGGSPTTHRPSQVCNYKPMCLSD